MKNSWKILTLILTAIFVFAGTFSIFISMAKADSASDIQDSIDKYTKKLQQAQKDLANEQSQLVQNQSKIKATKAIITQITSDITAKEKELSDLNAAEDANKNILSEYIRQLYFIDQEDPLAELSVSNGNLNDIMANFDGMVSTKAKIIASLQTIKDSQAQAEEAKLALAGQQQAGQKTLAVQQAQQNQISSDIQETQATVDDLKKELASLQSDLNAILGKSYSTDDIWKAVKFASDQTNVPRGFLMGVLQVESHLGANIGTGTYKKDMNPNQWSTFTKLCKSLGYNPDKQPVSRRVCYNTKAKDHCGGWGGAMGAEQFIPTTWMGYSSSVSSITGNSPADPWNLYDGVTAMALKLKKTPGVTSGSRSALKQAACAYLGVCSTSYINSVLYWADNYKQLLN